MNDHNGVRLVIEDSVYQEVMWYVRHSDHEVSGLGTVTVQPSTKTGEPTILRVKRVFLLPQSNTSTHTEIDAEAVGKLEYQLHRDKTPGELRWWWHSHVNMGAFWSGEDRATIAELSEHGWYCATVFNKRAERLSAFAQGVGPIPLTLYKIDDTVERMLPTKRVKAWQERFDANVRKPAPPLVTSQATLWSGSQHWWDREQDNDAESWRDYAPVITRPQPTEAVKEKALEVIFTACIEAGMDDDSTDRYMKNAERMLRDGHLTPAQIEHHLVQAVLERQAREAGKGASNHE